MTSDDWNDLSGQPLPHLSGFAGGGGGAAVGVGLSSSSQTPYNQHRTLADLHVANHTLFSPPQQSGGGGGGGATTTPMSILRPPSIAAARTALLWNNTAAVPAPAATAGHDDDDATGANNGNNYKNNNNNNNNSIAEMVARLEQEVLDKILQETDNMVRQQTDRIMEQQIQDDWEYDLNVWTRRELVGGRTLGGAAAGSGSSSSASRYHALPLQQAAATTTALARPRIQQQQQQQHYHPNHQQYSASASLVSATGGASSMWQSPMSSTAIGNFRLRGTMDRRVVVDAETLLAHVKIVKDLKEVSTSVAASVAALVTLTDPSKQQNHQNNKAASGSNNNICSAQNAGYATAWKWLQTLISSPTTLATSYLSFSVSSPDQATATLVHFCRQFQGRVLHRTRQATSAGQSLDNDDDGAIIRYNTTISDLAKQCAFYAQLELGITSPGADQQQQQQPPWPVLYYCLRCGDARAAWEVWQAAATTSSSRDSMLLPDGLHEAIGRILSTMDGGGGGSSSTSRCFWEFGIPPIAAQDRRMVENWLENLLEQQQEPAAAAATNDDNDIISLHRTAFLTLLSGFDQLPSRDKMPGLSSIEDYLLGCLWKAVLQPNPVEEVVSLGNVILEYGVNYFGDQESGGWAFALPLLATQRYATALTHLVEAGSDVGLMQAAHLALMLSKSGVPVVDLDHPLSNDAMTTSNPSSSDALVASLLVNFVNRLLLTEPTAGGPLAALEYLARIPNKNRARKEVASLIANTGDLERLAGTVNADGLRQDGDALDKHFSPQDVSLILKEAAELLSRDKGDKQKMGLAAMCYMLAGRYASVLVLLNEMLSPPNQQQDENRKFWIDQTKSFHGYYLKTRTHVMNVLEREGKLGLVQASRTMLEMNDFFEHMRIGQFADAWAISDRLELLPRSQADLAVMENKYRNLDDSIKRVYPSLLLGATETLFNEYTRIKTTDLQGPNASVARERLRELQEKGRAIETFAGLLGGVEQMGRISGVAARMV